MNELLTMNLRHTKSRQPEVIRAVQKDLTYTDFLAENLLDFLRPISLRYWIKYGNKYKCIAEVLYHSFAAIHNLQTLGEEYTGIVQMNAQFTSLPPKYVQLSSVALEFAMEPLMNYIIPLLEHILSNYEETQFKCNMNQIIRCLKKSVSFSIALHKIVFYINGNKYQISKRVAGINYATIRYWVKLDQSIYGYHALGWISLLHICISLCIKLYEFSGYKKSLGPGYVLANYLQEDNSNGRSCILCQNIRINSSSTPCGHLFCWVCLCQWLRECNECPVCRENIRKSNIIQLNNYF